MAYSMARSVELQKIRERVERSLSSWEEPDDEDGQPPDALDADRLERERLAVEAMLAQFKTLCMTRSNGLQLILSSMRNVARSTAADISMSGAETDTSGGDDARADAGEDRNDAPRRLRARELPIDDAGAHMLVWAHDTGSKLEHAHRLGVQALKNQLDRLRATTDMSTRQETETSDELEQTAALLEQAELQRSALARERDGLQAKAVRLEQALAERELELAQLRESGRAELKAERQGRLAAEQALSEAVEAKRGAEVAANSAEGRVDDLQRELRSRRAAESSTAAALAAVTSRRASATKEMALAGVGSTSGFALTSAEPSSSARSAAPSSAAAPSGVSVGSNARLLDAGVRTLVRVHNLRMDASMRALGAELAEAERRGAQLETSLSISLRASRRPSMAGCGSGQAHAPSHAPSGAWLGRMAAALSAEAQQADETVERLGATVGAMRQAHVDAALTPTADGAAPDGGAVGLRASEDALEVLSAQLERQAQLHARLHVLAAELAAGADGAEEDGIAARHGAPADDTDIIGIGGEGAGEDEVAAASSAMQRLLSEAAAEREALETAFELERQAWRQEAAQREEEAAEGGRLRAEALEAEAALLRSELQLLSARLAAAEGSRADGSHSAYVASDARAAAGSSAVDGAAAGSSAVDGGAEGREAMGASEAGGQGSGVALLAGLSEQGGAGAQTGTHAPQAAVRGGSGAEEAVGQERGGLLLRLAAARTSLHAQQLTRLLAWVRAHAPASHGPAASQPPARAIPASASAPPTVHGGLAAASEGAPSAGAADPTNAPAIGLRARSSSAQPTSQADLVRGSASAQPARVPSPSSAQGDALGATIEELHNAVHAALCAHREALAAIADRACRLAAALDASVGAAPAAAAKPASGTPRTEGAADGAEAAGGGAAAAPAAALAVRAGDVVGALERGELGGGALLEASGGALQQLEAAVARSLDAHAAECMRALEVAAGGGGTPGRQEGQGAGQRASEGKGLRSSPAERGAEVDGAPQAGHAEHASSAEAEQHGREEGARILAAHAAQTAAWRARERAAVREEAAASRALAGVRETRSRLAPADGVQRALLRMEQWHASAVRRWQLRREALLVERRVQLERVLTSFLTVTYRHTRRGYLGAHLASAYAQHEGAAQPRAASCAPPAAGRADASSVRPAAFHLGPSSPSLLGAQPVRTAVALEAPADAPAAVAADRPAPPTSHAASEGSSMLAEASSALPLAAPKARAPIRVVAILPSAAATVASAAAVSAARAAAAERSAARVADTRAALQASHAQLPSAALAHAHAGPPPTSRALAPVATIELIGGGVAEGEGETTGARASAMVAHLRTRRRSPPRACSPGSPPSQPSACRPGAETAVVRPSSAHAALPRRASQAPGSPSPPSAHGTFEFCTLLPARPHTAQGLTGGQARRPLSASAFRSAIVECTRDAGASGQPMAVAAGSAASRLSGPPPTSPGSVVTRLDQRLDQLQLSGRASALQAAREQAVRYARTASERSASAAPRGTGSTASLAADVEPALLGRPKPFEGWTLVSPGQNLDE